MNKSVICGRIVRDPELRYTPSGKAATSFTLAVKRSFRNASGEYESDFINCVSWGKQAELLAEYVKKGQVLPISGRIQTRNYDNKEGHKVYVTEVIVEEFDFPEKRSENTNNSLGTEVPLSDDIPF